jgi:beta-lactamase regulating signal transducer with metallopeptidase domain
MTVPELQVLAQIFTERLLNTAVEGIVLAGAVWLLLRIIGRQNPATRFAIWLSALIAVVALPFLSGWGLRGTRFGGDASANLRGEINLSSSWAYYLLSAWGAGALLSLCGLGIGLWRVRQIRRQCLEMDLASLDPSIGSILRDVRSRRPVKLCVSSEVAAPAAIGFFHPAIVFPAGLLSQLSLEEIRAILLHELAHLQRWDDFTNLAQKIVKAVFFFHPAVWWIENRLTLEREMACDDAVLAQTASPRAYAKSLISFAEKLRNVRGLALAQSLVSRVCQMSVRVAHILDASRPSRSGLWKPVIGVSAGLLVLVLGAAPYTPKMVAFQPRSNPGMAQPIPSTSTQQAVGNEVLKDAEKSRAVATNVIQPLRVASRPRAIAAAFNPQGSVVPQAVLHVARPQVKETQGRVPLLLDAQATREDLPMQGTFVILQTTRFDGSGSEVWTLCVWKVGGDNRAAKHWESAIVLSQI